MMFQWGPFWNTKNNPHFYKRVQQLCLTNLSKHGASSSYQHDLGLYFIKVFGPVVLLTWLFACDFSTVDLSRMFPLQPEHSLNLADLIYKIYKIDHYIDCISKTLDSKWLGSPTILSLWKDKWKYQLYFEGRKLQSCICFPPQGETL